MTTGSISFYKMNGSLSSGEYPLLTSGQNLTSYHIHTVTVKYAKGLQTRVVVPTFTNWEQANVAYLDGSFYWVTESRESTTYSGSVEMILDYMGPTSLFRVGSTVKGSWHKTASNLCPYLNQQITNGYMQTSPIADEIKTIGTLRKTPSLSFENHGYWVQVSGFTSSQRTTLKKVGFFIEVSTGGNPSSERACAGSGTERYPRFSDLITNLAQETGILADQVIDCSVSARCPYPYRVDQVSSSGTPPTTVYWAQVLNVTVTQNAAGHYIYDLSAFEPADDEYTISLVPSDLMRACGSYDIRDWNLNTVMRIPPLPDDYNQSVNIRVKTHSDISGIYTIISCNDQQIAIPEGKLPYIEDAWERYKAYQMDTDRQVMENAIRYAEYNFETDKNAGILNTVTGSAETGVIGGAVTGSAGVGAITGGISAIGGMLSSFYQGVRGEDLSRMQARDNFALSMKSAKQQPQTSYNVAYGLIYLYLSEINGLNVCSTLPRDVDADYLTAWVSEYGYPAEGVMTVTVAAGYYQGKLLSTSAAQSGMYWDECNKVFMRGFKFVTLS